jgi:holo-[acyl-carrier protein] synthase
MILGIGLDIVDKSRMEELWQRQGNRLIQRILTAKERGRLPRQQIRLIEYLAGRYAAKEAFAKATGLGIGAALSFQQIEILADPRGKPQISVTQDWHAFHYPGMEIKLHVSITHEKNYAAAQVIIEG